MKVMLTKDIKKVGHKWDLIEVSTGYFRNFLEPQGLAVVPSASQMKEAEQHASERTKKMSEIHTEAAKVKADLEQITLRFERKVTKGGNTLYAALHEKEVAAELTSASKLEIATKQINITKAIKEVGSHTVLVTLTEEVVANIKVEVIAA